MFQASVSGHLCGQAELGRRLGRRSAEEMEGLDTADERASSSTHTKMLFQGYG